MPSTEDRNWYIVDPQKFTEDEQKVTELSDPESR